ncbi:hypothetical protein OKW45_001409 [Paraburkholderia sp. WSM4175]
MCPKSTGIPPFKRALKVTTSGNAILVDLDGQRVVSANDATNALPAAFQSGSFGVRRFGVGVSHDARQRDRQGPSRREPERVDQGRVRARHGDGEHASVLVEPGCEEPWRVEDRAVGFAGDVELIGMVVAGGAVGLKPRRRAGF